MSATLFVGRVNKSEIAKLRLLLIILTLLEISYFVSTTFYHETTIHLILFYHVDWIVKLVHFSVVGILLWFNWKKLPLEKKKKRDNTLMILFLGIIGMWLWLPNKTEVIKMNENLVQHKA